MTQIGNVMKVLNYNFSAFYVDLSKRALILIFRNVHVHCPRRQYIERMHDSLLTNSMAYETQKFNTVAIRALE